MVIEDAYAIYDYISTNVRKEWEGDARSENKDPSTDPFLQTVSQYHWNLQVLPIGQVTPDPKVMDYVDTKTGYVFSEALRKRSDALQRAIQKYGSVIHPLIILQEDYLLKDGFCRFATLKRMNISKVIACLGVKEGFSE